MSIARYTRLCAAVAATLLLAIVGSCSGMLSGSDDNKLDDFFSQLPPLPESDGHAASAIVSEDLTGVDNWDNSGNVTVDGDMLTVTSAADRLDWVMYRYNLGLTTDLGNLTVDMTVDTGEAYVLVGDFTAGFWKIHGPYSGSADVDLSASSADFFSPTDNVYAVVAVYNGDEVTVNSSSLEYDDQMAAADYLADMELIFTDNCMPCHSSGSATSGIILDTYWNAFENADAALTKALADHAPTGAGTINETQKGTFQDWVDAGKPYGAEVTYTSDISGIIGSTCNGCHTGGGSAGGVDLDGYANAAAGANASWTDIMDDSMPPGTPLTAEQKDKWLAWLEQGTPE